jgi:hypothetical protein
MRKGCDALPAKQRRRTETDIEQRLRRSVGVGSRSLWEESRRVDRETGVKGGVRGCGMEELLRRTELWEVVLLGVTELLGAA